MSRSPHRPSAPGVTAVALALLLAAPAGLAVGCDPSGDDDDAAHVDEDGDGVAADAGDCDDTDPRIHTGAAEMCDGRDNDCDTEVDEGYDFDHDGYFTHVDFGCVATYPQTDCDDGDASIHPGAEELCNGVDDDCNGAEDDGLDEDLDGYRVCDGDCDDGSPAVHPGATDVCDGLDNDCDGVPDQDDDGDGDGWGDCLDCDDGDYLANPDAEEVCDGIDNDCDDTVDEGFDGDGDGASVCVDCDDTDPDLFPGNAELCDWIDNDCDLLIDEGFDLDADTYYSCHEPYDCDDLDPESFPGNTETCDGADNDCDGSVDEGLAADRDGDGYTNCAGDCLDTNGAVHPGATEVCDGLDDDCTSGTPTEERDLDGDGYASCDPAPGCSLALVSDGTSVVWNALALTLQAEGWDYDDWFNNASELDTEDPDVFRGYGLIVWAMDDRPLTEREGPSMEEMLSRGGRLLLSGAGALAVEGAEMLADLVRSSTTGAGPDDGLCTVSDAGHPIADTPTPVGAGTTFAVADTVHDLATADTARGAVEVVSVGGVSKVIAAVADEGRVVYWNGNPDLDDWDAGPDVAEDLFLNTLAWLEEGCRNLKGGDCDDGDAEVFPGNGCP